MWWCPAFLSAVTARAAKAEAGQLQRAVAVATAFFVRRHRQALEDRLAERNVPNLQLLRGATLIVIRQEMPESRSSLGPAALPKRDGYQFVLMPVAELEAAAERRTR